ncbi:MAG TPA: hypothetical protein VJL89_03720, partial [Thermodesulfovibrionia bacterium]|nr:hypothetical protein [Thermodesulfovibrionia bacterium]
MVWTQGINFSFKIGDVIYDNPKAYNAWNLNNFQLILQIIRAKPVHIVQDDSDNTVIHPGLVEFTVNAPNQDKTALERIGLFTVTQNDFVR